MAPWVSIVKVRRRSVWSYACCKKEKKKKKNKKKEGLREGKGGVFLKGGGKTAASGKDFKGKVFEGG